LEELILLFNSHVLDVDVLDVLSEVGDVLRASVGSRVLLLCEHVRQLSEFVDCHFKVGGLFVREL